MTDKLSIAARIAGQVPERLLSSQKTAHSFMRGSHGRRRVGSGEEFWQFRTYQPGDARRDVDWRQSAKRENVFIREREWETAQTLYLYSDGSASMDFQSNADVMSKKDYADILLLATAMITLEAGEQVGLLGTGLRPQGHPSAVEKIYNILPEQKDILSQALQNPIASRSGLLMISDFYMDTEALNKYVATLANRDTKGILLQVCDSAEENLPYDGRVKFLDIEDGTQKMLDVSNVKAIRDEYRKEFLAHRARVAEIAKSYGWAFLSVTTSDDLADIMTKIYLLLGEDA